MVKSAYRKLKRIHMIGIGGTGMNGIAEVLLNLGYEVSGSDLQRNDATRRLTGLGAVIAAGHRADNVPGADVVVISSAVHEDNVEVAEARRRKIPVIPRAEMLAELMRLKNGIAVAGSHGKTSTTSMIATILDRAGLDPTIVVGGRLNKLGTNARLGTGEFFVAEADESDRSFLYLPPFMAVLTNIDAEHLDQYKDVEELRRTFINFANKVPFYCPVVLCLDDPNLQMIIPHLERRIITYGLSTQSDVFARDLRFDGFASRSELYVRGARLGELRLNVPGQHMVLNAMAAAAVGLDLEIDPGIVLEALEGYAGTGRRFELKATVGDIMIVEDYAHHPTEIRATLDGAKKGWPRRLVAVFQPHRYTRVAALLEQFATSFNQADVLILTEIYPAGETPIPGITGRALFEAVTQFGHKGVHFEPEPKKAAALAGELAEPGDIILVMGAGNIGQIVPELVKRLEARP